ncbi:MAG: hypothetical protein HYX92_00190 [Chloroflexi bacterium]|nr:hypothetical protein [Chloroflexota bacterium]
MADAFVWWLWIEALGVLALPAAFYLFRNLPDRGYAFSKPLALLLLSYVAWLAGMLRLLPNARGSSILILFLLGLGSLFLFGRQRRAMVDFFSRNQVSIVATEALFTGAFVVWAVVRAYNPEIQHTEQPMDFAFLNGVLRSEYFPPNDPWLSGFSISYYYFGYLMMAQLVSLSGVASSVGYNLALALLFALAAAGAFSIVFNLVAWRRSDAPGRRMGMPVAFGVLAALLLVGVGNLEGALELLHAHGFAAPEFWKWISIKDLAKPYNSAQWYPTDGWWWWRATRVIDTVVDGKSLDYTISEFPYFSFLLGDMHPHVMSLPFTIMAIGLSLNIFRSAASVSLAWAKQHALEFATVAIALGGLAVANTWDFPTFALLFVGAALLRKYLVEPEVNRRFWWDWLRFSAALGIASILVYLPFYIGFRSQVGGILPVQSAGTRPVHFFIFWGLFLALTGCFAVSKVAQVVQRRDWQRRDALAALLVLAPLALWVLARLGVGIFTNEVPKSLQDIPRKIVSVWPYALAVGLVLFMSVNRVRALKRQESRGWGAGVFATTLLLLGLTLILGCELFYIKDVFNNRMNTVFKFYYQAWVLLAIGSAFAAYYIISAWRKAALAVWGVVAVVLLAASLAYPAAAVFAKTGAFARQPTLDGLAYIKASNPAEYEAIHWLKDNTSGAPVIVEVTGGSYSQYGRVSTSTGLPTLLGWAGHEIQWRGSSQPFAGRAEDIDAIYQSGDANQLSSLLKKYKVSYIYLGSLEKSKYGMTELDRFKETLDVAFKNQGVTIYRVRKE